MFANCFPLDVGGALSNSTARVRARSRGLAKCCHQSELAGLTNSVFFQT